MLIASGEDRYYRCVRKSLAETKAERPSQSVIRGVGECVAIGFHLRISTKKPLECSMYATMSLMGCDVWTNSNRLRVLSYCVELRLSNLSNCPVILYCGEYAVNLN